jgi:hypothetical protein
MSSTNAIRAGRAFVELFADDSKLVRGLKAAQKKLQAFGASIRNIGLKMAAIGSAVLAPLLGAAKVFSTVGDSIAKMAKRTGFSVETLSGLAFAASQSGSSIEDLEKGVRRMQRTIVDAATGMASAKEALEMLGLTAEDLQQLSPEEQFRLIADRLAGIQDPTTKAALAMEIFGRAGTQLLPMLAEGAKGIDRLVAEARRLGLVMSKEDAEAAEKLNDAVDKLGRTLKMGVFRVGAALAPVLTRLGEKFATITARVGAWVDRNRGLVVSVAKVAACVVAGGVAMIVLGTVISGLGKGIGVLRIAFIGFGLALKISIAVLGAILSPIGLVIAAVATLGAGILYVTGAGGKALSWLGEKFGQLAEFARASFQGIGDALAAGDIGLAAKILWLSLKLAWEKGTNALESLWIGFKDKFFSILDSFLYGGKIVWIEFTSFVGTQWAKLTGFLKTVWAKFSAWHAGSVESTANWIAKRWIDLQGLFDETLDVEAAKKSIDQQSAARFDEIAQQEKTDIADADAKKKEALKEVEDSRLKRLSETVEADNKAEKDRREAYEKKLQENQKELDATRKEWRKALHEARKKREGMETGEGPEKGDNLLAKLKDMTTGLGGKLNQVSVRGTFNPAALQGFAEGPAERMAAGIDKIEKNTRSLRTGGVTATWA